MSYIAQHNRPYERRHIVARMGKIGEVRYGHRTVSLWRYLTFWCGAGEPSFAAEFVRLADADAGGFLHIAHLKEGDIVVSPGLIYKKIPMSGRILGEHLRKMKTFKPKAELVPFKDTKAPVVDLGAIDFTGVVKQ